MVGDCFLFSVVINILIMSMSLSKTIDRATEGTKNWAEFLLIPYNFSGSALWINFYNQHILKCVHFCKKNEELVGGMVNEGFWLCGF